MAVRAIRGAIQLSLEIALLASFAATAVGTLISKQRELSSSYASPISAASCLITAAPLE